MQVLTKGLPCTEGADLDFRGPPGELPAGSLLPILFSPPTRACRPLPGSLVSPEVRT